MTTTELIEFLGEYPGVPVYIEKGFDPYIRVVKIENIRVCYAVISTLKNRPFYGSLHELMFESGFERHEITDIIILRTNEDHQTYVGGELRSQEGEVPLLRDTKD